MLTPFGHGLSLLWEVITSIYHKSGENWLSNRKEEPFYVIIEVNPIKFLTYRKIVAVLLPLMYHFAIKSTQNDF